MRRRIYYALAGLLMVVTVTPLGPPALADDVDDVIHDAQECEPNAGGPVLFNYRVQGSGGVVNCEFNYYGFTVCLDWNGKIQAESCASYFHPDTEGSTNEVICKPGLWATTVLVIGPQSTVGAAVNYIDRHSNPAVFVKDCVAL